MYKFLYDRDWLDFFKEFNDTLSVQTTKLKTYNPDEYDLVLKKDVIEKKIKEKEEQIRRLESQKKLESEGWDNRIKSIQSEIDKLKTHEKEKM